MNGSVVNQDVLRFKCDVSVKLCGFADASEREINARLDSLLLLEAAVKDKALNTPVKLQPSHHTKIDSIIRITAEFHGVSPEGIRGPRRNRTLVYPRQVAMAIAREITEHSLPEIGESFNRDHTTVFYALRAVNGRCRKPSVMADFNALKAQIVEKVGASV